MIKRHMISIDGDQIERINQLERKDLKGYDKTKRVRIALQEWLRENKEYIGDILQPSYNTTSMEA